MEREGAQDLPGDRLARVNVRNSALQDFEFTCLGDPASIDNLFYFIGVDFNRGTLVDHLERKDKPQAIGLPNEYALHTHHGTALDANFLAYDQIAVWLQVSALNS